MQSPYTGEALSNLEERASPLFFLCILMLSLCFILGGHSDNGMISDALLQFFSVFLLFTSLIELFRGDFFERVKTYLYFVLAMFLLPLIQLAPLPFGIWSNLPMREKIVSSLQAINQPFLFQPMTFTPEKTWLSLLAFLPPASIFLAALLLSARDRWRLVYCVIVFAVINAFLGLLQISANSETLYLYPTLSGEAVGFFVNRNHFSALFYASFPFVVAAFAQSLRKVNFDKGYKSIDPATLGLMAGSIVLMFIFIAAGVMSRSRAGVALLMLSILLSAFLPRWTGVAPGLRKAESLRFKKIFFAFAGLATLFALQYGLFRILDRFDVDPLEDARFQVALLTLKGGWNAFPVGTGIGSFVKAYYTLEKPRDLYSTYVNEAHNEYLQLLLEGGAPAVVLLLIFLLWFGHRTKKIWGQGAHDDATGSLILQRAASLVLLLFGLHAVAEFELRTEALASLFAICCAILIPVARGVSEQEDNPDPVLQRGNFHNRRRQQAAGASGR